MALEAQIQSASFNMNTSAWQAISASAKDLVRGLLRVNVRERMSTEDCFRHPWVMNVTSPVSLPTGLAQSLEEFSQVPAATAPDGRTAVPLTLATGLPQSFEPNAGQGPTVSEVSSGTTAAGPVPTVNQPSTLSEASVQSGSTGRTNSMDNPKADTQHQVGTGVGQRFPIPSIQIGAASNLDGSPSDDMLGQEQIFCLNELLKLQVSIAGSLEVACLAFRHTDVDLSIAIRKVHMLARNLSQDAANVVSHYGQVAQQVSQFVLPDLRMAVQEKESSLAVSLLGMVKEWVSSMKKDGEETQVRYMALQESVTNLIQKAQATKLDADRQLAEAMQELEGHPPSPRMQQYLPIASAQSPDDSGCSESSALPRAQTSGSREPDSPGAPGARSCGPDASKGALHVPFSMNTWTRQLFEQLSQLKEGRGEFFGPSSGNKASDVTMAGDDVNENENSEEVWKRDVLELLFMAPGVVPHQQHHEALKPEEEDPEGGVQPIRDRDRASRRGKAPPESQLPLDVQSQLGDTALVLHAPPHKGQTAQEHAEARTKSSMALLRALRELKRVDEILQGCSNFWANMDGTVKKLAQMKEHTEVLVNFASSSKSIKERFEQRLNEYIAFWTSLDRLCRQYCIDHQAASKKMYDVIREVADVTDVMDTTQSARMGMVAGMRDKQRREER
mmetsp:Transcript_46316/g.100711  ORF Transcript_46316/g.100711 Transcript_46316/m.100711 type:complete len:673 (+) Transcript_46316:18-2036(+)